MLHVRSRLRILMFLYAVPFLVILGRLFQVQVVEGKQYRRIANEMGRTLQLSAPGRGRILSREGEVLATNQVYFDLVFTLDGLHPRERIFANLQKVLGVCTEPLHSRPLEICTCDDLERHLIDRIGSPEDIDVDLLQHGDVSRERLDFVEDIAATAHAQLSRHRLGTLKNNGLVLERDAADGTYVLWVEPVKIFRMDLTLLRLSRLCDVPHGAADPALTHTLRGRVAAAVEDVRGRRGGATDVERMKLYDKRNALRARQRPLVQDVSKEVITEILCRPERYPGVRVVRRHRRSYPLHEVAGVITGYVNAAPRRRVEAWKSSGVLLDSRRFGTGAFFEDFAKLREWGRFAHESLGARGIESAYDDTLRGRFGVQLLIKDMRNRPLAQQPHKPVEPIPGKDIRTTIDVGLQKLLARELASACGPGGHARAGSAVVMALREESGAIDGIPGALLGMACFPSFDPDRMHSAEYLKTLQDDANRPVFNRVVSPPRFPPPGSIFKLVVAVAALESGLVDGSPGRLRPRETYDCRYFFDDSNRRHYRCNSRAGHGVIDLEEALKVSCNCYFYDLAKNRLTAGILYGWARNFGFGRETGIDLPLSAQRQRGRLADKVSRGQMPSYGIGDRFVEASPLQVTRAVAALALDGTMLPVPYLGEPRESEPLRLTGKHTARVVRAGMRRAVVEPGGTAATPELRRFSVAVKTGTAQITRDGSQYFAWIAGFAPFDRPRVAFAICMEYTPLHGAEATAPMLARILGYLAQSAPGEYLRQEAPRF